MAESKKIFKSEYTKNAKLIISRKYADGLVSFEDTETGQKYLGKSSYSGYELCLAHVSRDNRIVEEIKGEQKW